MLSKKILLSITLLFSMQSYAFWERFEFIDDGVKVQELMDLQAISKESVAQKKVILLEFSADYCAFCVKLEDNVLKPMIRSHDYDLNLIMRAVHIDQSHDIISWHGGKITPSELAKKYNVYVTPTVLLINDKGEEIAERQVGINMVDFYAEYLDREIIKALKKIQ